MKFIEHNLWLLLLFISALALAFPDVFIWALPYLPYLLALVMLFMGVSLKKEELLLAIKQWKFALLGTALQFFLMPSLAYVLGICLNLSLEYRLGLLLVGVCPGGTASNVIVYLFRGNVPLSVLMTFLSTILSVLLTPFLLEVYIGKQLDLPGGKMIQDIFVLVLIPLIIGYFFRKYSSTSLLLKLERSASFISMSVIALIVAAILAANKGNIASSGTLILLAVFLHNGLGLLGGYWMTRLFTKDVSIARTIAIEVGMQNSGLGVVLATLHFTKLVALPSAIFSFWHNVSGITLAGYWKRIQKNNS